MNDKFKEEKVRNFYYLLAYAFEYKNINFYEEELFGTEKFNNICDLFSIVIYKCMENIIREGLYSEYVNIIEETRFIKGRVDIVNTISKNFLKTKGKAICDYDNYTTNNILNQIVKTTIIYLIKSDIINENRRNLKKYLML